MKAERLNPYPRYPRLKPRRLEHSSRPDFVQKPVKFHEKQVVRSVLEAMILKHGARRLQNAYNGEGK